MSNYTENHIPDNQNHSWSKILNFVSEDSEVLDIGCSSGGLGELLIKNKSCVVDGVEPDKKDSILASNKLNYVWNSDIETALLNIRKKYDIIIFADVLEHILHPDEVLRAIKRIIKPKGRVVFSVPNMSHVSLRLALLRGDWEYNETGLLDKTHLRYWDLKTIRELFIRSNMNLIKLDTVTYPYTDKLIKDRLKDMGLIATERGLDLLKSPEASAFQIVGYAEFSKVKQKNIKLPETALNKDIEYAIRSYKNRTIDAEKYASSMEKKLNLIINSKSYIFARRLSSIINRFHNIF